jgi:uridine kinase
MRDDVLNRLASIIISKKCAHPVRVAIDGVDAVGKTTLADELATLIQAAGHPVIRASLDGFHNPRAVRHQRGSDSPEG